MGPCPYCGDQIGAEARICKHCQRPVLYTVSLTASLDDRQKHELIRLWQKEEFRNIKHLSFGAYAEAKKQLDKIPLALAWDLNLFQASSMSKKFAHLYIEPKLQGGLPSTADIPTEPPPKFHWTSAAYGLLMISLIVAAVYFILERRNASQPVATIRTQTEGPKAIAPTVISISPPTQNVAPTTPSHDFPNERKLQREDIETLLSATVFVSGENSLGSGFLISADGYIITNNHVIENMAKPYVTLKDQRKVEARVVKKDSRYDIALIKIDLYGLPYFKLGDANKVYAGEPIITIGNPAGLAFTITRGIVSFNGRNIGGVPYLQTDAAINRGNSGGPMINQNLEVIGINTLTSMNEQGISFSLPINLACDISGVANGVNTTPASCEPYQSPQAGLDTVSRSAMGGPKENPFDAEIKSLNEDLKRREADIIAENEKLKERHQALLKEGEADPMNKSLHAKLNEEAKDLAAKSAELNARLKDAKVNYLNGLISVLERAALAPEFSSQRAQIENQIAQLRQQKETLLAEAR